MSVAVVVQSILICPLFGKGSPLTDEVCFQMAASSQQRAFTVVRIECLNNLFRQCFHCCYSHPASLSLAWPHQCVLFSSSFAQSRHFSTVWFVSLLPCIYSLSAGVSFSIVIKKAPFWIAIAIIYWRGIFMRFPGKPFFAIVTWLRGDRLTCLCERVCGFCRRVHDSGNASWLYRPQVHFPIGPPCRRRCSAPSL